MTEKAKLSSYQLGQVQRMVGDGEYRITLSAARGAQQLGFDEKDIVACVRGLADADFGKTMRSEKVPGLMQDVYRPVYLGRELYVKLQLGSDGKAVVVSFKQGRPRKER